MEQKTTRVITVKSIRDWLVEKFAQQLGVEPAEIDVNRYFNEFELNSARALILTSELEDWLGMEVEVAVLWYYPTIAELSLYLAEEQASHAAAA
jgi:acyl carrier protein